MASYAEKTTAVGATMDHEQLLSRRSNVLVGAWSSTGSSWMRRSTWPYAARR
jgi:hypothetical protein